MSSLPRSRGGRTGLYLLLLIELAAAVALVVALGLTVGIGVSSFAAVVSVLVAGLAYRRARRLGQLMRSDPAAAQRMEDRDATRVGKFCAGVAFATIGAGIVAIIAIFATHV